MTWMGGAAATAVISSADSVFQSLLYYCVCPYVNVCVSVIQYKTTRATSSTCSSGVINYLNHDDEFPWIFAAESNLFTSRGLQQVATRRPMRPSHPSTEYVNMP
jgi:hypothetical protein